MKVIHADMLVCKFCNKGARQFCERHGINWQVFVTQGIEISEVEHIDDEMLKTVIAQARKRVQEG